MKFISFEKASAEQGLGLVVDNAHAIDLVAFDAACPPNMIDFIAGGQASLALAQRALDTRPAAALMKFDEIKLLAPIPRPAKNVFCVGRNYKAHVEEGYRARGAAAEYPPVPQFFTKAPTAVFGPSEKAWLDTKATRKFDYEAELGIVIGKSGRNIAPSSALAHVFGYTILNDFTARDLQREHGQWFKGKSLDHSCAMGPWIVAAAAVANPQDLSIRLSVNGEERQASRTSRMIFSLDRIIAELSKGMTLEPGDVIATGTPAGVGYAMEPPVFLKDRDVVSIDIEAIGQLVSVVEDITQIGE